MALIYDGNLKIVKINLENGIKKLVLQSQIRNTLMFLITKYHLGD
jgi:hypothetical protein